MRLRARLERRSAVERVPVSVLILEFIVLATYVRYALA